MSCFLPIMRRNNAIILCVQPTFSDLSAGILSRYSSRWFQHEILYMTSFFICILGSKSFCTKLLLHLQEAMMMRFKATLHHAQSLLVASHQTPSFGLCLVHIGHIFASSVSKNFLQKHIISIYHPTVLIDLAAVTTSQTPPAFPPTSKVTTPIFRQLLVSLLLFARISFLL
jgi:hypothetical protein